MLGAINSVVAHIQKLTILNSLIFYVSTRWNQNNAKLEQNATYATNTYNIGCNHTGAAESTGALAIGCVALIPKNI